MGSPVALFFMGALVRNVKPSWLLQYSLDALYASPSAAMLSTPDLIASSPPEGPPQPIPLPTKRLRSRKYQPLSIRIARLTRTMQPPCHLWWRSSLISTHRRHRAGRRRRGRNTKSKVQSSSLDHP